MIAHDDWEIRFTQAQLSMIATLLANREPLCCSGRGWANVCAVVPGRSRREQGLREDLASHAYEHWGCTNGKSMSEWDHERADRFFHTWVADLGFETDGLVELPEPVTIPLQIQKGTIARAIVGADTSPVASLFGAFVAGGIIGTLIGLGLGEPEKS